MVMTFPSDWGESIRPQHATGGPLAAYRRRGGKRQVLVDNVRFLVGYRRPGLAHEDDDIAQLLTPVALLDRHTTDAVEHTVLGEQVDEPLDVQDITPAKWYARRTSASVPVVIAISHPGTD
jgi:hypothetical protein